MPCIIFLVALLVQTPPAHAQVSLPAATDTLQYVIIDTIIIKGHRRTKPFIIRREMNIATGDTLPLLELLPTIRRNKDQITNLQLFSNVALTIHRWQDKHIALLVEVEERWYTLPVPLFELADRNFNVWWTEFEHDFSRTQYGLKFIQENVRGRNETFRAKAQMGFTEKIEAFYTIPYIDRQLRTGLEGGVHYSRNKQVAYATKDELLAFKQFNTYVRQRFYALLGIFYRRAIHHTHFLNVRYQDNRVDNAITDLNPHYFMDGRARQQYFQLRYTYLRDYRNIQAYPLKGSLLQVEAIKTGTGIFDDVNMYELIATYGYYQPVTESQFAGLRLTGKASYPEAQPYYNQEGLGFKQNFVRGYEFYVVDGQQFLLLRTDYKWRLFEWEIKNRTIQPKQKFETLPVGLYFKIYADAGYVHDDFYYLYNNNKIANTWQLGTGVGLDLVTFYTFVFRFEYSMNRLLDHGFYLHFKSAL